MCYSPVHEALKEDIAHLTILQQKLPSDVSRRKADNHIQTLHKLVFYLDNCILSRS